MVQFGMDRTTGFAVSPGERFEKYTSVLMRAVGHADRAEPLRLYCAGLLLPGERKSVEPMAARLAPDDVRSTHQRMHHLVADSPWSDRRVLAAVRDYALPVFKAHGGVQAWIVDDTGIPKKGKHSVGVARQYCGVLGKQENCQVAVSLSVANERLSLPIAYELYLPETWVENKELRRKAGIPDDMAFRTKLDVALAQLRMAVEKDVPRGVVLGDAGYGNSTAFRDGITAMGLTYAVGIQASTTVWPQGEGPAPAPAFTGRGRPPRLLTRDADHQPVSAEVLAQKVGRARFRSIIWRQGTRTPLKSRFCALRVRPAHRDYWRAEARAEEWLLIEWPAGQKEPTKYFLSTLPADTPLPTLVRTVKLRWRIERDYEELKDELGLDHYEGRGWRGFHHHATLCIAAYGFLAVERGLFSPSGVSLLGLPFQIAPVPEGFRPRGAPDPGATPRSRVRRDHANTDRSPAAQDGSPMSLLSQTATRKTSRSH
jgi:SRSO17 transposase